MPDRSLGDLNRPVSGVGQTIESDNIVRWDGERLYVEQDIYENGQLMHRKYRRTVSEPVARALATLLPEFSG